MGKYKKSTPEQRTRLNRRYVNIKSHITTATREKNRILRLAKEIGLSLDYNFPPEEYFLEHQICDRLINKRVLSELLAGNQLSITNRYCPKIYKQSTYALESLVLWWVKRMLLNKKLRIDVKKLGIKNPLPISPEPEDGTRKQYKQ